VKLLNHNLSLAHCLSSVRSILKSYDHAERLQPLSLLVSPTSLCGHSPVHDTPISLRDDDERGPSDEHCTEAVVSWMSRTWSKGRETELGADGGAGMGWEKAAAQTALLCTRKTQREEERVADGRALSSCTHPHARHRRCCRRAGRRHRPSGRACWQRRREQRREPAPAALRWRRSGSSWLWGRVSKRCGTSQKRTHQSP
jgi:hypothetical protein